jgi:hypothetical protein
VIKFLENSKLREAVPYELVKIIEARSTTLVPGIEILTKGKYDIRVT